MLSAIVWKVFHAKVVNIHTKFRLSLGVLRRNVEDVFPQPIHTQDSSGTFRRRSWLRLPGKHVSLWWSNSYLNNNNLIHPCHYQHSKIDNDIGIQLQKNAVVKDKRLSYAKSAAKCSVHSILKSYRIQHWKNVNDAVCRPIRNHPVLIETHVQRKQICQLQVFLPVADVRSDIAGLYPIEWRFVIFNRPRRGFFDGH